jgi:hypothetical protein
MWLQLGTALRVGNKLHAGTSPVSAQLGKNVPVVKLRGLFVDSPVAISFQQLLNLRSLVGKVVFNGDNPKGIAGKIETAKNLKLTALGVN